jgi:single-stranded DNA-binding protein
MKPTKPITDPSFKYTPAAETNVALTFARVRRELKKQQQPQPTNVTPLKAKPKC